MIVLIICSRSGIGRRMSEDCEENMMPNAHITPIPILYNPLINIRRDIKRHSGTWNVAGKWLTIKETWCAPTSSPERTRLRCDFSPCHASKSEGRKYYMLRWMANFMFLIYHHHHLVIFRWRRHYLHLHLFSKSLVLKKKKCALDFWKVIAISSLSCLSEDDSEKLLKCITVLEFNIWCIITVRVS